LHLTEHALVYVVPGGIEVLFQLITCGECFGVNGTVPFEKEWHGRVRSMESALYIVYKAFNYRMIRIMEFDDIKTAMFFRGRRIGAKDESVSSLSKLEIEAGKRVLVLVTMKKQIDAGILQFGQEPCPLGHPVVSVGEPPLIAGKRRNRVMVGDNHLDVERLRFWPTRVFSDSLPILTMCLPEVHP
jgi:hypothetical protein